MQANSTMRGLRAALCASTFLTLMIPGMAWSRTSPSAAGGLPTGGTVVGGNATIASAGGKTTITQSSAKAIINWQGFSIGQDNSVQFNNGSGATLNRVTGSDITSIDGALTATGSVYVLNPNGVIIGKTGVVKAGGSFVASTLGISDAAFLAGGTLQFSGSSTAGIKNFGHVGSLGGNVALIAAQVANAGTITAPNGTAGLVAGYRVTLRDGDHDGNGLFSVQLGDGDTNVVNTGQILAAAAELRAEQGNVYALAGDTTGLIRATGVASRDGKIWLTAGDGGSVTVSGTQLSAVAASGDGGAIALSGGAINVATDAAFDASATTGSVGGKITAIADMSDGQLVFQGSATATGGLSGDGGFVETSGHAVDFTGARIDTSSARGKSGLWLVDPDNLTVDAASATTITSNLATTDVTLKTTSTTASGIGVSAPGAGDILINAALNWSSAHVLTLDSWHGIQFNADVTVGGTGGVVLKTNDGNSGGTGDYYFSLGKSLSFTGAGQLTINGASYTLLHSMADLAATNDPGGVAGGPYPRSGEHFALATNLTAGLVSDDNVIPFFDSTLTGLGHTVDGLTINSNTFASFVGLIGENDGIVRDLGLTNVNLSGTGTFAVVGGIAGYNNFGSISNSYVTGGSIHSSYDAGGIAGQNAFSVNNSFTGVTVDGADSAGGIVGFNLGTIKDTYATGAISSSGVGSDGQFGAAGGIAGVNLDDYGSGIVSSYASGAVTGVYAGGVVGSDSTGVGPDGTVTNSYWDTQTSGISTSAAGSGRTTAQLQGILPGGFDTNVWGTGAGLYPYLKSFGLIDPGQKISGFAYNANGSAADAATLDVYSGGALLGGSSATSGANGYYYIIVPTGTADASTKLGVTETLSGQGTISGATYHDAPTLSGADVVGLDVTSGTFALHTGRTFYQDLLNDASGVFGSGVFSNLTATLNAASLKIYAAGAFTVDRTINNNGAILIQSGGALTLSSSLTSAASGDAIVLAANGAFHNVIGVTALTTPFGRWLVYTQAPGDPTSAATGNNSSGLVGVSYYDDIYDFTAGNFATAPGAGNRFVTGYAPTLTLIPVTESVIYNGSPQRTVGTVVDGYLSDTDAANNTFSGATFGLTTSSKNVGSYTLTASGTITSSENYRIAYGTGTLTITPAALTLTASGDSKVYDGNTASDGSVSYSGLIGGDTITGLSESFDSRNAGSRTLGVDGGYTIADGNGGGNYVVTLQTASGSITPAALTLIASNSSKTYDGNATSDGSVSYSGLVGGDTITGLSESYDSRNAGSRTLGVDGSYTIADGNGGGNYTVTTQGAIGGITPAALTLAALADTKTYDGTTTGGAVEVSGLVSGDSIGGLSDSFDSRNAGARTLTVNNGYVINDGNGGGNYTVTTQGAIGSITPAALTLSASADSKTYDGTTASSGTVNFSGLVSGDTITGLSESYDNRNAGSRTLGVDSGYTIADGNGGGNYTVTLQGAAGSITPAALTLIASSDSKTYDGTTTSSGSVSYSGLVSGDTVTGLSESFDNRNAGSRTLGVDSGYTITDGNGGGNYTVTLQGAAGSITPAALTLIASTDSKTYDGTVASSGSVNYSGLVSGDTITGLSESFESRNAGGRTLTVNSGYTIADGNGGGNYTVTLQGAAGSITPAALLLAASPDTKTYDGTTTGGAVEVSGLVSGDSIGGLGESFDSRNTGARTLTVNNGYVVNDGNGGGNYTVTTQGAIGSITPAALTLSASTDTKTYDGTTTGGAVEVSGLVNGDSIGGLSDSFDSRNAGARTLTVNNGYVIADGNGGGNYVVTLQTATGRITPAALTLIASGDSKVYDGTTGSSGTVTVSGLVGGDTVTGLGESFDSRNAGARTLVIDNGYVIADGNGGGNYTVTTQGATGNITPAALTLSASADSKVYDGTTASSGSVNYSGLVGGDTITGLSESYDSRNAGNRTLSVDGGYTIADGNGGGNYAVTIQGATGNITPAALTLVASTDTKTYDGTTASGGAVTASGLVGGDTITGLGESYDSRNAGSRMLGVDSGYTIADGNGGGNYTVTTQGAIGSITPAALTLVASTDTKVYDGTTASGGSVTVSGLVGGDTITGLGESYDSRNAGSRTLGVDGGYAIADGNGGGNYTVTAQTAAGSITPAALTLSASTGTKIYDGTTASGGSVTASGLISGDTITGLSESYDSRNAGSRMLVVDGGYTIADGNGGGNYTVNLQGATGSITPATLTLIASADTKIYDGATTSGGSVSYSGLIGGDTITGLSESFDSRNAGNRTLGVDGGYTIADGNGGGNYSVTLKGAAGSITPAALTLTASTDTRVYDGTTGSSGMVAVSGLVGGDTVTGLGESFDSRNAGSRTLGVDGGYTIADGNGGGNYTVTTQSATGTITPAALTLVASTDTKIYDGTTASDGSVSYTGLVGGDTISGLSESFDNRNAGSRTLGVDGGYVIADGNGGGNYTVTTQGAGGSITPAALTLIASGDTKIYDGTTASSGSVSYSGLVGGDTISGLGESFDSRNAGSRTLGIDGGYVIADGNGGGNYVVTLQTATGSITPAALTLIASGDSKVYDGTTGSSGTVTISGLVGGDTVTGLGESFDSRNAGGRTLGVDTGYTVADGNGGGNYTVTTRTAAGSITPAALTLIASGDSKVYDGNITSDGSVSYSGLVGGDTISGLSESYDNRNAGNRTLAVDGGYTIADGNGGGNYTVTLQGATGSITPAALTLNASTDTKTYDGTIVSDGTVTFAGLVGGDTITGLSESFDGRDAGARALSVNGGYVIADGNGGANYTVTRVDAAGQIDPRAITITADDIAKFAGSRDPALTYAITDGAFVAGDGASGALTRAVGEAPGTYAIEQGNLSVSSNYTLTFVNGSFTIQPVLVRGTLSALLADHSGFTTFAGIGPGVTPDRILPNLQTAYGSDLASRCRDDRSPECRNAPYPTNRFVAPGIRFVPGT